MSLLWFQISRTPRIGVRSFYKLQALSENDPERCVHLLKEKGLDLCPREILQKEIDKLHKLKGRLLYYRDPQYPAILKQSADAPPFLMMFGRSELFQNQALAIVGARNASIAGISYITQLSRNLGERGFVIASGLARGIDGAAHKAALKTGTIAVLAGGIDQVYPSEHQKLYDQIKEQGVILSEMPLGAPPTPQLFPRRNRIISGLSKAIIIAEAAKNSGSLITANYALEQGKEIFVVPGHPSDPRSEGGHRLIQEGAHLLHSVTDVIDALGASMGVSIQPFKELASEEAGLKEKLLGLLSTTPIPLEELLKHMPDVKPHELMIEITNLELDGLLTRDEGIARKV